MRRTTILFIIRCIIDRSIITIRSITLSITRCTIRIIAKIVENILKKARGMAPGFFYGVPGMSIGYRVKVTKALYSRKL